MARTVCPRMIAVLVFRHRFPNGFSLFTFNVNDDVDDDGSYYISTDYCTKLYSGNKKNKIVELTLLIPHMHCAQLCFSRVWRSVEFSNSLSKITSRCRRRACNRVCL